MAREEKDSVGVIPPLSSLAIPARPSRPATIRTVLFDVYFLTCIFVLHTGQLLLFPLQYIPQTNRAYHAGIDYIKGAFAKVLVTIVQFFAPSNLVLSFRDEHGNQLDPTKFIEYGPEGQILKVKLPKRSIWISNHQVYTDWLYLWVLAYYCECQSHLLIILKDSLKWLPIVGIAMQYFDFIFLARKWAKDQITLNRHLKKLARQSHVHSNPLALLIFPEGTLVSKDTRPISRRYSEKAQIDDCTNLLLPRSTGLLYCARTLKKDIDELKVVDFTIGYPGIPPAGYGQSYYTLRSIFMQGIPPPSIHISITLRDVAGSNPSESVKETNPGVLPLGDLTSIHPNSSAKEIESSEAEHKIFDQWLLERWREKDELLNDFYKYGDFVHGQFSSDKAVAGEYYRRVSSSDSEALPDSSDPQAQAQARQRQNQVASERAVADLTPTTLEERQQGDQKPYVILPIRLRQWVEMGDVIGWGATIVVAWSLKKLFEWEANKFGPIWT